MPETSYPLAFDFARKIDGATGIGTIGHYYDGTAQDLFISDNRLVTIAYELKDGNWKETHSKEPLPTEEIQVGNVVNLKSNTNYYDIGVNKTWIPYVDPRTGRPIIAWEPVGYYEYERYIRPLPEKYYGQDWIVYEIRDDRVTLFGTDSGELHDKFDVKMEDIIFVRSKPLYNQMEKSDDGIIYGETTNVVVPGSAWVEKIRFDHVSNGYLYFMIENKIYRYNYALDLSPVLESWDYSMQSDSPVNQFNADVMNISAKLFSDEMTLFQPGSRISLGIYIGEMPTISFGETWLDECSYSATDETVSISSRNLSGYFLKDQTLDKSNTYKNMPPEEVLKDLLRIGQVRDYEIEPIDTTKYTATKDFEIKGSSSILDAIDDIISEYDGYMMLEDWQNKVYIGSEEWMFEHFPNGNFIFDEGRDLFSRKTTRSADAAFVKVMVDAKEDDKEGIPISADVPYYKYWNLGAHKTKHFEAPEGMVGADLSNYATKKMKELQYTGIKEELVLSIHPEILVGDIGTVKASEDETEGIQLGLITEIQHSFSRDEGWRTSIVIDSGGEYTNRSSSLYNKAASIFGYNRKQSVLDIVKMTNSGGVSSKVITINNGSGGAASDIYSMSADAVNTIWNNLNQ